LCCATWICFLDHPLKHCGLKNIMRWTKSKKQIPVAFRLVLSFKGLS
jgi:hypothetical protein